MITANELAAAYAGNELAADQRWKGRVVRVSGRVDAVHKGVFPLFWPIVYLGPVKCFFPRSSTEAVTQLKQGQLITLAGKVYGRSGASVELHNCSL